VKDREAFLSALDRECAARAGPLKRIHRALERLHAGFTGNRGGRPEDYLADPDTLRAYLASFAVPNAVRAATVLAGSGVGLRAGERALDAGAGTGASALALASISDPDTEIVLADQSEPALEVACDLFATLFPSGPRAVPLRTDLARELPRGTFQTVVAGHLLNELLPRRGREPGRALTVAGEMAGRLTEGGTLVLLESAQRIPSQALGRIRERAIAEGFFPVGPCTHSAACPVLHAKARDWCVVDVPWQRTTLVQEADRLLGTDRRRLAVSYLALSRSERPAGGRVHEILSEPMRTPRGILIYLCGEKGRLVLRLPRAPNPPVVRGARILLPADAVPSGRDRSGAPLLALEPEDVLRLKPGGLAGG